MSEFEKELEKNMKLRKIAYKIEGIDSDPFVSKWCIERVFKDWQPPKPQQALPVVPECVGEFITKVKKAGNNLTFAFNSKFDECPEKYWNEAIVWRINHPEEFALAFITDNYQVEKSQLFYLKNKIKLKDVGSDLIGYLNLFLTNDGYLTSNINRAKKFTQQEIDSMQTGSYEQKEVEP